jgi:cellulose synthase/poly-beta-1,6-N-acetylglucosamine synthase-like glycosyltransferase
MAFGTQSSQIRSPTVSVVIPAYNTAKYVSETLESVFGQTYQDFEVIVINDGSPDTDAFEKVIEPYLDRIVYLKQENRGPAAARNLGIRVARGKYIAFLDSDDSWLPEYLASQMKMFEETPPPDIVSADTRLFGDSPDAGKRFWELYPPRSPATLKSLLTKDCAIVTSCTVARREVLTKAGLFDENFYRVEDFDLWLRLAYAGAKLVLQQKVLARRRAHGDALTVSDAGIQIDEVRVLNKLERTLQLPSDVLLALQHRRSRTQACLDVEQGKRYLDASDIDRARDSFQRAYVFFRTTKLRLVLLGLQTAPRLTTLGAKVWRRWLRAALGPARGTAGDSKRERNP